MSQNYFTRNFVPINFLLLKCQVARRNVVKLNLSNSFFDFVFWDLPRIKLPLLLIPIILIVTVSEQITRKSVVLPVISVIIYLVIFALVISRFAFYLSPRRKIEKEVSEWLNDDQWKEMWMKRIDERIMLMGYARESSFMGTGFDGTEMSRAEVKTAMLQYFSQNEFIENIIFVRSDKLPILHPLHSSFRPQWMIIRKGINYSEIMKDDLSEIGLDD